jgi:N utilization substance protein B
MTEAAKKPQGANPSLQKKTAARMAAVQGLYTMAVTDEKRTPAQIVAALKERLANNREEQKLVVGVPLEPNYKLVEELLEGTQKWHDDIDTRLESSLSADWKRDRVSPLIIAILQCAIFEMFFAKEIAAKIVIDEYTRLTRSFFADAEVNFMHGALSKLARTYAAIPPHAQA